MKDKTLEELKKEMNAAWAAYAAWDTDATDYVAAHDAYNKKLKETEDEG